LLEDSNWKNPTISDSDLMKFVHKGKRVENFLEEEDIFVVHFIEQKGQQPKLRFDPGP
jgi:hypothetical protein